MINIQNKKCFVKSINIKARSLRLKKLSNHPIYMLDFDEMPVVYRIDCQLMIESYFFLKIVKNTYLEYTLNKAAQMKI